jgi:AraC-like DNA-binding protein
MNIYELIEQTLTYRYDHGVHRLHFDPHRTEPGTWRTLPFLAMVYAFETDYEFEVRATGTVYTARPGEIVFVPADMPHRFNLPEAGVLSAAHIRYSMLGALDPMSLFVVPHHFNRQQAAKISDTFFSLITANQAPAIDMSTVLERKETAFRLLRFILDHSRVKKGKTELLTQFSRVRPVLEYIENNLDGQISRDYLAEIAFLSPARFNFLFRETIGLPPMKYVQNRRQSKAQELLSDTDLTIAQIADRLGYCDQFHFSRQFKKLLGTSPSSYRAALKQGIPIGAIHQ